MPSFLRNTIFFIGWMLSPLTFWNDAFINIPIAYLLANIYVKFFSANFLFTVLVFYWISNFFGVFLMCISGSYIIKDKQNIMRELRSLLITIISYSFIVIVLAKVGILKPLSLSFLGV